MQVFTDSEILRNKIQEAEFIRKCTDRKHDLSFWVGGGQKIKIWKRKKLFCKDIRSTSRVYGSN